VSSSFGLDWSWIPPLSYQTIPHFFLQVTLHAHIFLLARNVYYTHDEADRTTYPANKIIILYSSRSRSECVAYIFNVYHVIQSIIQIILSHNVSNTCLNDYGKKLRDVHLPSFPSLLHPESFHCSRLRPKIEFITPVHNDFITPVHNFFVFLWFCNL
jgi:hypothetical protein